MALVEQLEALPANLGQQSKQAEQREIGSFIVWVSSFMITYVAIVAEAHPEWVRDMLGYMTLIIRGAHNHGGQGWLTCDTVFCHNIKGNSQPWTPPSTQHM